MNLKQADLGRESIVNERRLNGRVQIKASYINRLKALTAVAFAIIVALLVTVFQLNKRSQLQSDENSRLSTQISVLQNQINDSDSKLDLISAHNDSTGTKALTYIESIQSKLRKINTYMSKRGLSSIPFKASSSKKKDDAAYVQLYRKYNTYLEKLVNNIAAMPMGYPRVSSFTSFFGYRGNPFNGGGHEFHPGIDFRGRTGDPVHSTASGRVVFAGRLGGYGNCVRIKHGNDLETCYGHLSRILVKEGQHVNVGELIGKVGSTGRSTGPHLHYEVRVNGRPVNPKQYLALN